MWIKLLEIGRDVPAQYYEQPDLSEGDLGTHWQAFSDLGTERQFGMGIGPIPRSKVIEYGEQELLLRDDALDDFVSIIRRADGEYLGIVNPVGATDKDKIHSMVSMNDPVGIGEMMNRLAKKSGNPEHKKQNQKP